MVPSRALAASAALFLFVSSAAAQKIQSDRQELVIRSDTGEHAFSVELADDPAERSRGLMYRREMGDREGMLFDFDEDRNVTMWMKNTYIPLDMLFIRADGVVHHIAQRTTPLSERQISSGGPIRYVLEINGGVAEELGIEPGDQVEAPAIAAD